LDTIWENLMFNLYCKLFNDAGVLYNVRRYPYNELY